MKRDLSLGITTGYSLKLGLNAAVTAEKYGLKGVWIGEDIGGPRDIFTYTSRVLSGSTVIEAGIGVVSPFYHNLSTIARSSATLVELYGERLRLGLGVGGLNLLKERGITPYRTVEGMEVAVAALRKIFSGESVSLDTFHFNMVDYSVWGSFRIPVYFGVRGPKLLRLASKIADGIILSGPKLYVEEASKIFSNARIDRGLKVVVWLPTALIDEDDRNSIEYVMRVVATVAADTPNKVLEISGLDGEIMKQIRREVSLQRWDKAADLIDWEFAEIFLIYGSSKSLIDKLLSWAESAGIDEIVFGPPYGVDPAKAMVEVGAAWKLL